MSFAEGLLLGSPRIILGKDFITMLNVVGCMVCFVILHRVFTFANAVFSLTVFTNLSVGLLCPSISPAEVADSIVASASIRVVVYGRKVQWVVDIGLGYEDVDSVLFPLKSDV